MDIKIAICDDDKIVHKALEEKILKCDLGNNKISIDTFISGRELISKIKNGIQYDVIFMDIDFKDNYLGTDTGIIIKMFNPMTLIVYISFYENFYPDIVTAEPFSFLKKPVDQNQLNHVVRLIINRIHYINYSYMYSFKSKGMINTINLNDVKYFESQHRIVLAYEMNGAIISFYKKLDEVEKEILEIYPYFVRANKSFLVNLHSIKSLNGNHIMLINEDTKINVTSKYKKELLEKFSRFVQKTI